jgi:hypothetical protein
VTLTAKIEIGKAFLMPAIGKATDFAKSPIRFLQRKRAPG